MHLFAHIIHKKNLSKIERLLLGGITPQINTAYPPEIILGEL